MPYHTGHGMKKMMKKPAAKKAPAKKPAMKKGSKAMKDKMAKLRAMRKKK